MQTQSSKSSNNPTQWDESNDATALQPPTTAFDFFSTVQPDGYPEDAQLEEKVQPWKSMWKGIQKPSEDGKLLVACPKTVVYGVSSHCTRY